LNVTNNSTWLYERYKFLRDGFRQKTIEAEARKNERNITKSSDGAITTYQFPSWEIEKEAGWMALAAIDAFFSWTEHVFIHFAILNGRATTGHQVAKLAVADWKTKFKLALDLNEKETNQLFEALVKVKEQLRNFTAHGAFGKEGEAFRFHSGAGAVPVILIPRSNGFRYSISSGIYFDEEAVLATIDKFIDHLWSDEREPARIYIQVSDLPLMLTMARDGTYAAAMRSTDRMNELVEQLNRMFDDAANMDW
jgi:hypothetical protein